MLSTVAIPSAVVEPDIKAKVCEIERNRLGSITHETDPRVKQSMLVHDDRLLSVLVFPCFCVFGSVDPESAEDIIVFSCVVVFLEGVLVFQDELTNLAVFVMFLLF